MAKAASGGMLEVELGKLVVARAATPKAKRFAQQMVTNHQKSANTMMAHEKNDPGYRPESLHQQDPAHSAAAPEHGPKKLRYEDVNLNFRSKYR